MPTSARISYSDLLNLKDLVIYERSGYFLFNGEAYEDANVIVGYANYSDEGWRAKMTHNMSAKDVNKLLQISEEEFIDNKLISVIIQNFFDDYNLMIFEFDNINNILTNIYEYFKNSFEEKNIDYKKQLFKHKEGMTLITGKKMIYFWDLSEYNLIIYFTIPSLNLKRNEITEINKTVNGIINMNKNFYRLKMALLQIKILILH